jgi:hypothetical protein
MSQLESQSERLSHRAKNFFLPSVAEASLFILLNIILLIIFNTDAVIKHLDNSVLSAASSISASYSTFTSGFNASFSDALGGRLGQILLWAFIGALAYIGLWLAKNVLNSFENDIISDHYLHPSSYSHIGYWGSSLSVKTFLLADALVLIAYLFVFLKAVMPGLAALTASAAYNFKLSTSPLYILGSVLAGAILLYIFWLLLRFTGRLWKLL